jgi:hypothetical protein
MSNQDSQAPPQAPKPSSPVPAPACLPAVLQILRRFPKSALRLRTAGVSEPDGVAGRLARQGGHWARPWQQPSPAKPSIPASRVSRPAARSLSIRCLGSDSQHRQRGMISRFSLAYIWRTAPAGGRLAWHGMADAPFRNGPTDRMGWVCGSVPRGGGPFRDYLLA